MLPEVNSVTLPSAGFPGVLASVSTKSGIVIEGSFQGIHLLGP